MYYLFIKVPAVNVTINQHNRYIFKAHVTIHEGVEFPCNECDYKAECRSNLQVHTQFQCTYCMKLSSLKDHLLIHHITHTKYLCIYCTCCTKLSSGNGHL